MKQCTVLRTVADLLTLIHTAGIIPTPDAQRRIDSVQRDSHAGLVFMTHRLDAQVLREQTIFGVKIWRQVQHVLGEGVGVCRRDCQQHPLVRHRVAVVNLR